MIFEVHSIILKLTVLTILNDDVNQFKVGLELDKGHFTLKVKTVDSDVDVPLFLLPTIRSQGDLEFDNLGL
jgi:hypothetical protein